MTQDKLDELEDNDGECTATCSQCRDELCSFEDNHDGPHLCLSCEEGDNEEEEEV